MELLISARSEENGELSSARFTLDGALTLGRGPESPLLLDGNGISREHFRLHSKGGGVFVTDLSSNGTWLNTERLKRNESRLLVPADSIKIPGFQIRIEFPNASLKVAPTVTAGPVRNRRHLESAKAFAAGFSRVEKLLIACALATVFLLAAYLSA